MAAIHRERASGKRGRRGRTRSAAASLGLLASLALAAPALALHQRVATLALPAGASPTSSALAVASGLLIVGTRAAAAMPELLAIDLGADLRSPAHAWSTEIGATVHDVAVDGGIALLATADDAAELVLVDLASGQRVGSFDAAGTADALSVRVVAPGIVKLGRRASAAPELYRLDVRDPAGVATIRAVERRRSVHARRVRAVPLYAHAGRLVTREDLGGLLWLVSAPPDAELAVVERIAPVAFADANGDGIWRLGCAGDSNTMLLPAVRPGWCELLRDAIDDPDFEVVNVAVQGATVTANRLFASDAAQQMAAVLEHAPDAVVLAFGTNDRFQGRTPDEIEDAYEAQADVAAAAGVAFHPATTPPLGGCIAGGNGLPCQQIAQQNALLRAYFGARVLEFHDTFATPHFLADTIHLNTTGQILRAERALDALAAP